MEFGQNSKLLQDAWSPKEKEEKDFKNDSTVTEITAVVSTYALDGIYELMHFKALVTEPRQSNN